jgi:hypothetical protein
MSAIGPRVPTPLDPASTTAATPATPARATTPTSTPSPAASTSTGGPSTRTPLDPAAARLSSATARAQPLALPSWYPPGFDLDKAAREARGILEAQGEPPDSIGPGKAKTLIFTDADLTLINSAPPSLLKHKQTGEHLKHPETGEVLRLGLGPERDAKKDLARLKTQYPSVPWRDYKLDDSAYGSRAEILATPAIGSTVRTLKASDRNPASRDFVITARSHGTVAPALDEYLRGKGADINGVFAVNHIPTAAKLGTLKLSSQQKKAVTMAALLKLYQPADARLDTVKFLDDTDKNLVASMQLLPKLYPKTRFEFYDVVHTGNERFERVLVARSDLRRPGELVDSKGKLLTPEQIAAYKSEDALFPDRNPQ